MRMRVIIAHQPQLHADVGSNLFCPRRVRCASADRVARHTCREGPKALNLIGVLLK